MARVNGQAILRRDFDLAVQLQFAGRRPAAIGLQELRAVREKVLGRLIDSELLYESAQKDTASVTDGEVDRELKRMQDTFGSPEAFARVLKENQVTESQFREQLRRSLLVTRFVDRQVAGDVKVGDEDVRRYYDQNPAEMKRPERVRVSQIMVRVKPEAPAPARSAARERIEAIMKELRDGKDFAEMARRHSDGPEAQRGGDTGFLLRGRGGPQPIEAAAFALQPGETSDIIETRLGYHIIKVTEKRPAGVIPFDEAQKSIRSKLTARERDEKIQEYLTGLRQKARIERRQPAAPQAR